MHRIKKPRLYIIQHKEIVSYFCIAKTSFMLESLSAFAGL